MTNSDHCDSLRILCVSLERYFNTLKEEIFWLVLGQFWPSFGSFCVVLGQFRSFFGWLWLILPRFGFFGVSLSILLGIFGLVLGCFCSF